MKYVCTTSFHILQLIERPSVKLFLGIRVISDVRPGYWQVLDDSKERTMLEESLAKRINGGIYGKCNTYCVKYYIWIFYKTEYVQIQDENTKTLFYGSSNKRIGGLYTGSPRSRENVKYA